MDSMERQVQFRNSWIFLLLFLISSCTAGDRYTVVNNTDEGLEKRRGKFYYNDQLLTGEIIGLFENGDTSNIAQYRNGIKEGTTKKWWENGNLKFEGHYHLGNYHGVVAEWYENGQPYTLFNYDNGKESGKQQAWKPNGNIKANYEVIGDRKYGLTGVKNCSNVWEN